MNIGITRNRCGNILKACYVDKEEIFMFYLFDLLGTAVFAVTGCMAAKKKRMDLFGGIVLAIVTAVGGGTIRDLVIGKTPVFWVTNDMYILVSVLSALITFVALRFRSRGNLPQTLVVLDAFGLAIFTVIGTQKAIMAGCSELISVSMGIMTGVLGGIIRDVLAGRAPLILRSEIYATASFIGSILFVICVKFNINRDITYLLPIFFTFVIRLVSIRLNVSLPRISNKNYTKIFESSE